MSALCRHPWLVSGQTEAALDFKRNELSVGNTYLSMLIFLFTISISIEGHGPASRHRALVLLLHQRRHDDDDHSRGWCDPISDLF